MVGKCFSRVEQEVVSVRALQFFTAFQLGPALMLVMGLNLDIAVLSSLMDFDEGDMSYRKAL